MTTLKDIRERWEKATPGPWTIVRDENDHWGKLEVKGATLRILGFTQATDVSMEQGFQKEEDAKAIANAPTDIAYLLDLVERAKAFMLDYQGSLSGFPDQKEVPYHNALDAIITDMESAKGGE